MIGKAAFWPDANTGKTCRPKNFARGWYRETMANKQVYDWLTIAILGGRQEISYGFRSARRWNERCRMLPTAQSEITNVASIAHRACVVRLFTGAGYLR